MKWIKVEDKVPPQGVCVIVARFDHRKNVKMHFVLTAQRVGDNWFDGHDGEDITSNGKYGRVTHWMHLPDEPGIDDN